MSTASTQIRSMPLAFSAETSDNVSAFFVELLDNLNTASAAGT